MCFILKINFGINEVKEAFNFFNRLYVFYPARTPLINSPEYLQFNLTNTEFSEGGLGRSAGVQAGYQLAGLAVTLGLAIVTGILTGIILKTPLFEQIKEEDDMFDDEPNWIIPSDELFIKNESPQATKQEPFSIIHV